jgi:hypothetical protein
MRKLSAAARHAIPKRLRLVIIFLVTPLYLVQRFFESDNPNTVNLLWLEFLMDSNHLMLDKTRHGTFWITFSAEIFPPAGRSFFSVAWQTNEGTGDGQKERPRLFACGAKSGPLIGWLTPISGCRTAPGDGLGRS